MPIYKQAALIGSGVLSGAGALVATYSKFPAGAVPIVTATGAAAPLALRVASGAAASTSVSAQAAAVSVTRGVPKGTARFIPS